MKRKGKRTEGKERGKRKKRWKEGKWKKEKEMEKKGKVLYINFLPTKTFQERGSSKYLIKLKKFLKLTRLTRPLPVLL